MACILEELEKTLKKQLGNTKNSKEFKDGAAKAKERVAELSTLLNEVGAMKKAMQGQLTNDVDMYSNLPNRKGNTFTNHTGGAYGADSIWADMLRLYGVDNKHYRPVKDMPTKRLKDLSAKKDEVVSITKEEQDAGKALNTKLGNSVHDLNNRNFVQILNADAVFAVAPIKNGKVQGGTGSATRMASELGKQVYVLDTETVQWMKEVDGNYVILDELPKFPINFAAVGTRGIESYPKKNRDGSWGTTELHNNTKAILELMQKTVDNSFGKTDKKKYDKSIFKRSNDTYYTKNSVNYKIYRIPKPENKNLVSVRNIMQSMITALRSDLSFGNGVKDIEETYVKYSNIYTKEIKELSILLREHQLNLKKPHSLKEWENIYKEDLKLNKKFDDIVNALVSNLGLDPIIKSDQVDGYEFGFSAQFVTKEDNTKQETDIILPNDTFIKNVNKKIECKE